MHTHIRTKKPVAGYQHFCQVCLYAHCRCCCRRRPFLCLCLVPGPLFTDLHIHLRHLPARRKPNTSTHHHDRRHTAFMPQVTHPHTDTMTSNTPTHEHSDTMTGAALQPQARRLQQVPALDEERGRRPPGGARGGHQGQRGACVCVGGGIVCVPCLFLPVG